MLLLPRKRPNRKRRGPHPYRAALSAASCRDVGEAGRHSDGDGLYLHVKTSGYRRWALRLGSASSPAHSASEGRWADTRIHGTRSPFCSSAATWALLGTMPSSATFRSSAARRCLKRLQAVTKPDPRGLVRGEPDSQGDGVSATAASAPSSLDWRWLSRQATVKGLSLPRCRPGV